jgi:threonine dehydratase
VLLKLESLQRFGSFKIRGAYNRLAQLDANERRAGVVAFSSGNHAQGVAGAARMLGIRAIIVMPADAPRLKLENTKALGAEVVLYDRYRENREDIAARILAEHGGTLVPAFDDPHIVAGQGTAGLELMQQAKDLGLVPEQVLIGASGGGLLGGSALAIRSLSPATAVWAVEPQAFDDISRSLAAGCRLGNPPEARTICDALMSSPCGAIPFALMRQHVAGGLAVSDEEVLAALAYAFRVLKLVIEPGGAVALAAVLAGKLPLADRTTAILVTGGNVDPETFCRVLGR